MKNSDVIRDSTQINFLMEMDGTDQEAKASVEHQALAWISENEVKDYKISNATKGVIMKTFKLTKEMWTK